MEPNFAGATTDIARQKPGGGEGLFRTESCSLEKHRSQKEIKWKAATGRGWKDAPALLAAGQSHVSELVESVPAHGKSESPGADSAARDRVADRAGRPRRSGHSIEGLVRLPQSDSIPKIQKERKENLSPSERTHPLSDPLQPVALRK